MYPNHQGKFDALGIIHSHDAPCSIVMDLKRSKTLLTNEFIDVLDGIRLDKDNLREQLKSLRRITTRIHFLKPLYYEDYKDLSTKEIADCVKMRIQEAIKTVQKNNG